MNILLFHFRYRNTYKHNLCVDMLQNGFHLSFCELFALIKQQEDARVEAGQESLMWTMVLLKDQHEKLDMLKLHLTRAENAQRKGLGFCCCCYLIFYCTILTIHIGNIPVDKFNII